MDAKLCPICGGPLRPNLATGQVIACPHCGKPIANPSLSVVPASHAAGVLNITTTARAPATGTALNTESSSNRLPVLFVGGILVGALAAFLFLVLPLVTATPKSARKSVAPVVSHQARPANQPDRTGDGNLQTRVEPFSVDSETTVEGGQGHPPSEGRQYSVADVIELMESSVVRVDVVKDAGIGTGSGFFITADGVLVTNNHVVEGAQSALVTMSDGTVLTVGGKHILSRTKDLALLHAELNGRSVKPVKLAGKLPRKGEQVVSIGAPQGLSFSASEGIVSAVRSSREARQLGLPIRATLIQTTTPVSGGNSGGPLVNLHGEVVGITTLGSVSSEAQNINFAVSNEEILALLRHEE